MKNKTRFAFSDDDFFSVQHSILCSFHTLRTKRCDVINEIAHCMAAIQRIDHQKIAQSNWLVYPDPDPKHRRFDTVWIYFSFEAGFLENEKSEALPEIHSQRAGNDLITRAHTDNFMRIRFIFFLAVSDVPHSLIHCMFEAYQVHGKQQHTHTPIVRIGNKWVKICVRARANFVLTQNWVHARVHTQHTCSFQLTLKHQVHAWTRSIH